MLGEVDLNPRGVVHYPQAEWHEFNDGADLNPAGERCTAGNRLQWVTADSKGYLATIDQRDRLWNGQRERYSGHVRVC